MKVLLIRHGQTTGDVEDRYGGDYDDSLSTEGMMQAHAICDRVNEAKPQKVFVSPKARALETALILKRKVPFELVSVSDLRERNQYGVLTGLVKSDALKKFPDDVEELNSNDPYHHVSGSEEYFAFAQRVTSAFNLILEDEYNHKTKSIAFLTHSGPIRVFFREVLGFEIGEISDCAIIELDYDGEGFEIISSSGIEGISSSFS